MWTSGAAKDIGRTEVLADTHLTTIEKSMGRYSVTGDAKGCCKLKFTQAAREGIFAVHGGKVRCGKGMCGGVLLPLRQHVAQLCYFGRTPLQGLLQFVKSVLLLVGCGRTFCRRR